MEYLCETNDWYVQSTGSHNVTKVLQNITLVVRFYKRSTFGTMSSLFQQTHKQSCCLHLHGNY